VRSKAGADRAQSWILFEKQPFDIALERDLGTWTCTIPGAVASAETAPLAVCRALLKVAKAKHSITEA
jgi:hypothetical protein